MRNRVASVMLTLFLFSIALAGVHVADRSQARTAETPVTPPQAAPVYNLLKAIETNNFTLYESAWVAEEVKEGRIDRRKWRRLRREEVNRLREILGSYKLAELTYTFEGDESRGRVVIHGGRQLRGYSVVNEGGVWRIYLPKIDITPPKPKSKSF